MYHTIINTIITFIISGILGYCLNIIKNYTKQKNDILEEFKQLKESQLLDMKSDLSNKFYIYEAMNEIEDYLVMAFQEKCERYFKIGGNTWIKSMYEKSFEWKIKPTGYLK
jgi:cbb3-type cytochrome oxidase cytochrome c subunit